MKPQAIETRERLLNRQQTALEAIELAHEKEGRELGYVTYGGPILCESDTLERYDSMLAGLVGKQ